MSELMEEVTTTESWPSNEKGYTLLREIGRGASAVVLLAYCKSRFEKCAIKCINLDKSSNRKIALKEIETMKACDHENIVKYYTSFYVKEEEEYWLVMSLSEGGSLLDILRHKMRTEDCYHGIFDEVTIATVLKEVLKALEYLHTNGKIHRDVKADNIFVSKDGTVQLGDLGLCAWLPMKEDHSRSRASTCFVGTHGWMAPEVMQTNGFDFKVDIWSFGITAIEMVIGSTPYACYNLDEIVRLTLYSDPPTIESACVGENRYTKYGNSIRKMIANCLQKDPAERPTASELLKHPFFMNAEDKKFIVEAVLMSYLGSSVLSFNYAKST